MKKTYWFWLMKKYRIFMCGNKLKKVLYSLPVISVYHEMIKVFGFFFMLNFLDIDGKKHF